MMRALTNRPFLWLSNQLAHAREQERQARFRRAATLGSTAQIRPEGSIENMVGDASCVRIGEHTHIRGRLLTYGHGGRIAIGAYCYVGIRTEIWSMASIEIGDRVLIAHDVNIHDGTAHSQNVRERHEHYKKILASGHPTRREELPGICSAPIVIEDDVWISFGVTILRGVRIGKGSIVAANSIVTNNVPPGMLYRSQNTPIMEALDPSVSIG
jgi:acetyltransferase-like isoleucine patch superfamily enzyme